LDWVLCRGVAATARPLPAADSCRDRCCTCGPHDTDRCDYRLLADHIEDALNPPDGDEAEVSLCMDAVTKAADYIRSLPCTCGPGAAENEVDPCRRCAALGLAADRPVDR
jgi:hypothetical protein